MSARRVVAIAMSGGVDSSVAAALLAESGVEVIGVMMRLWTQPNWPNRCCSPQDMSIAREIAAQLGIPFYAVDAQEVFKKNVVDYFLAGYQNGITPNPCIECNRIVRWSFLFDYIRALGADVLATGHYARVRFTDGQYQLCRAEDHQKDQSYVLSVLNQDHLAHALFPLGELTKGEVYQIARQFSLPVVERRESQDLCFLAGRSYVDFLAKQDIPLPPPGPICDLEGKRIGEHQGLAAYTIGQRKGIGISTPYPLYVIKKDFARNMLIVGPRQALGRAHFIVHRVNWIGGSPFAKTLRAMVQVRYRAREVEAEIDAIGDTEASVHLDIPVPGVAAGQSAVFYQGEQCLGGGIIQS
jgi:tRNA-specific 2-thiouridylase